MFRHYVPGTITFLASLTLLLAPVFTAAPVSAQTTSGSGSVQNDVSQPMIVADIIAMHQAGLSDGVIMAKMDEAGAVFQLTVEEILKLKEAGISDAVITYMINSGKYTGQEAPATEFEQGLDEAQESLEYEAPQSEGYSSSYDADFRVSVAMGFGYGAYYYPAWPGYAWGWYYDPFYWPSWGGYFAWCTPYPYWRSYSCWYPTYSRCSSYWGYGDRYAYVDSYGRDVGNRGPATRPGGRRVSTDRPVADAVSTRQPRVRNQVPRVNSAPKPSREITGRRPNSPVVRQEQPKPRVTIRPPRTSSQPVRAQKPPKPAARQKQPSKPVVRAKPPARKPAKVTKPAPAPQVRKPAPAPSRAPSRPAPARTGKAKTGRKG